MHLKVEVHDALGSCSPRSSRDSAWLVSRVDHAVRRNDHRRKLLRAGGSGLFENAVVTYSGSLVPDDEAVPFSIEWVTKGRRVAGRGDAEVECRRTLTHPQHTLDAPQTRPWNVRGLGTVWNTGQ